MDLKENGYRFINFIFRQSIPTHTKYYVFARLFQPATSKDVSKIDRGKDAPDVSSQLDRKSQKVYILK